MSELYGTFLALGAAVALGMSMTLQASVVGEVKGADSVGLIKSLLTRKKWLVGLAFGIAYFILQFLALRWAPLTIVQPMLALSLIVILAYASIGARRKPEKREWIGVALIIAGVAGVTAVSPAHYRIATSSVALGIITACFAFVTVLPWLMLRAKIKPLWILPIAAGVANGWAALLMQIVGEELSPVFQAFGFLIWGTLLCFASVLAMVLEQMSYQKRPAGIVAPIVFVLMVVVPIGILPALGIPVEHPVWSPIFITVVAIGAVIVASSKTVGDTVAASAG